MKKLDTSFFNVPLEKTEVKTGDLLIADPFMKDKWFGHSVISIIDHGDAEGTTGVVLNLPLPSTLDEVFKDVTREDIPVFCGGPLGHDRLFFIHTLGDGIIPGSTEISPGLWLGGQFPAIVEYVNSGYDIESNVRFFVGYSGWSAGQLREELTHGSWALTEKRINPHTLLDGGGASYWHKIIRELGRDYRKWGLLPGDTTAN